MHWGTWPPCENQLWGNLSMTRLHRVCHAHAFTTSALWVGVVCGCQQQAFTLWRAFPAIAVPTCNHGSEQKPQQNLTARGSSGTWNSFLTLVPKTVTKVGMDPTRAGISVRNSPLLCRFSNKSLSRTQTNGVKRGLDGAMLLVLFQLHFGHEMSRYKIGVK